MVFPQTLLPLVTEVRIGVEWAEVTGGVHGIRRENGAGVRISRKPLSWARSVAHTTSDWVFKNPDRYWSPRHPLSANYGLLNLNSQVRHRLRWVRDTFTRSVTDGWGSTDTGQAWILSGGANPGDYDVTGTRGTHLLSSVNVNRFSTLVQPVAVQDVTVTVSVDQVATGGPLYAWVLFGSDTSNLYAARLIFSTGANVTVTPIRRLAGTDATLASAVVVGTYGAGTQYRVRVQRRPWGWVDSLGSFQHLIRVKAWPVTLEEPATWTTSGFDDDLSSFTIAGVRSAADAANTNVNPVVAYDNLEVNDWRFWGEMPSLEPQADNTGLDRYVPVQAAGITRRLTAPSTPRRSAPRRYLEGLSGTAPVGSWTLEEGPLVFQAEPTHGLHPLQPYIGPHPSGAAVGYPQFGTGSLAPWLPPVVSRTAQGGLTIVWSKVEMPVTATTWSVDFAYASSNGDQINGVDVNPSYLGGSLGWPQLTMDPLIGTIQGDVLGAIASATIKNLYDGQVHHVRWVITQNGGNADWQIFVDGLFVVGAGAVGAIPIVNTLALFSEAGDARVAVGYLAVWTTTAAIGDYLNAIRGYRGEDAATRISRVCGEEGIYFELFGSAADTETMGPQQVDTPVGIMREAADVDQGILYEPRDALGYAYRTRFGLYNSTGTGPALEYDLDQLIKFQIRDDTDGAANLVTAERTDGASATVETTVPGDSGGAGGRSTQNPPSGIGVYDEKRSWNLDLDSRLLELAGWRRHIGSWDAVRFPAIGVALHRMQLAGSPSLMGAVAATDFGGYLSIADPRDDLPPDLIQLLMQESAERLANLEWEIEWDTALAGPYMVGVYGANDPNGTGPDHYSSDGSTTGEVLDTTETGVDVSTPAGPLWTTDADDFPFDVMIGGERMTVSAITGAASPQTFTVTRSVNGIVKTHASGVPVRLFKEAVYAR